MMYWRWVDLYELQGQIIDDRLHPKRWFEYVGNSPVMQRAYATSADIVAKPGRISPEVVYLLYNQTRKKAHGIPQH